MEITTTYGIPTITHTAADTCPECQGHGYTTIEIREQATIAVPEYTVTYPVTCYRTRPCWRCRGRGMVRE